MSGPPVPVEVLRRIVELATRAPSIHNTQPWRWRAVGTVLELRADTTRQLSATDPTGRNLVISCGAALHHARMAAAALGWPATVDHLPDPSRPNLLARLRLTRAMPVPEAVEIVRTIERRRTDRRRFTSWPVPETTLAHLAVAAERHGTRALPIVDVTRRFRAERIVALSRERQSQDPAVAAEQRSWVDRSRADGVPSAVLPAERSAMAGPAPRFDPGPVEDLGRDIEGCDGLVVLYAATDGPRAWLAAGEGLSALWLAATEQGLSVVPLSQPIEEAVSRREIGEQVLDAAGDPLLLIRIGWQAISRSGLPTTPRRAVEDVLDLGGRR